MDATLGETADCAAINQAVVTWAQETLGATRPLAYGDDVDFETGPGWLKEGAVTLDKGVLTTARMKVGDDPSIPEAYRSVLYCKLWTPARALYYVLTGK